MHPVHIMPKPAGSTCNLNCAYCYYLEKQKLYAQSPKQEMSDETLERYIHDYIAIQPGDDVLFTWHGGEPLAGVLREGAGTATKARGRQAHRQCPANQRHAAHR